MTAAYAIVEVMGHQRRAGVISEVTFAAVPMLRIEHTSMLGADGLPFAIMYGGPALFSVAPCSFEQAVDANRWGWRDPALDQVPSLAPGVEEWTCPDCGRCSPDCLCCDEFGDEPTRCTCPRAANGVHLAALASGCPIHGHS